jgi:hypothetical protein
VRLACRPDAVRPVPGRGRLDVHPRVAMAILRHAQFATTMEIYTEVSDAATRNGLKKLGDNLT